jgi:hypothetical protein
MMRKVALAVAVLAAAAALLAGPVVARSLAGDDTASSSAGLVKASPYKNVKPLIGVLAQPCSDCPGR